MHHPTCSAANGHLSPLQMQPSMQVAIFSLPPAKVTTIKGIWNERKTLVIYRFSDRSLTHAFWVRQAVWLGLQRLLHWRCGLMGPPWGTRGSSRQTHLRKDRRLCCCEYGHKHRDTHTPRGNGWAAWTAHHHKHVTTLTLTEWCKLQ